MKYFDTMNDLNTFVENNEWKNAPNAYKSIKAKHRDRILLFSCGNFYEAYCEDAQVLSELTSKTLGCMRGVRICGFPECEMNAILTTLIRAGHRVGVWHSKEELKKNERKRLVYGYGFNDNDYDKTTINDLKNND